MAFDALGPKQTRAQQREAIDDMRRLEQLANAIAEDAWPLIRKVADGILSDDFLSASQIDELIEGDVMTADCMQRYREHAMARDQKPAARDQFGR
jgi:hypothetical protein